jgi:predicted DsbA family dithiol-disulfide isomerase
MTEAGRTMGIQMERPWIVPWTRKAHELACHAARKGCFREIHDTLFRAYLVEGVDIGRVDILVELGRRHGLEPMETKAALDIDLYGKSVVDGREAALGIGVDQTPTLFFLGRKLGGYPEEEKLARFLAPEPRTET